MWDLIMHVKGIVTDRLNAQRADPTAEFPLLALFVDETNMFSNMSVSYWRTIKDQSDPATPSIWREGIAPILWTGRSTNVHAVFVGQRLDEKATGGIGLRDSLGFRGLAGFRKNQWDMLIGTTPVPRAQKPKGRWIYSDGQTETWVQNLLADKDSLRNSAIIRDYAQARRVLPVAGASAPVRQGREPAANGSGPAALAERRFPGPAA
jgi:hypothetical protein